MKLKWLSFLEGVVNTPAIARSAELLDPYFEGEPSVITSGLRSPEKQLAVILEKIARHGFIEDYAELKLAGGHDFTVQVPINDETLYWWQRGWSRLLSIGDIVNPPIPAKVMFDYYRPGSNENKKGQIIQISPHQRGLAFDIGGGSDVMEKAKRVMKAHQEDNCFIESYLVERVNNAVHVDVRQIG